MKRGSKKDKEKVKYYKKNDLKREREREREQNCQFKG
jgi:hypothetical protein